MITEKKAANAVGGKTARACDSCLRRRASWFCAADDAFLCQACDASVHSANQLASRHQRLRLQISSVKPKNERSRIDDDDYDDDSSPAWHRGFIRKARTPRHNKPTSVQQQAKGKKGINVLDQLLPVVPEIGSEVGSPDGCNEEQLLYRVPIFDPFAAELCHEMENTIEDERFTTMGMKNEVGIMVGDDYGHDGVCDLDDLQGFLSSEMELDGLATDVESLLGKGLHDNEESAADIKGLGLLGYCKEEDGIDFCIDVGEGRVVKVEEEDDQEMEADIVACDQLNPLLVENMRETLDWKFDYELQQFAGDQEQEKVTPMAEKKMMSGRGCEEEMKRKEMLLRLNYEEVITAWAGQGCPWTTGTRPEINPDKYYWQDFMEELAHDSVYGETAAVGIDAENHVVGKDHAEGREARVSRYREKRRTRLFSKKIRYQVRKLNAEKRPRMKGRFVKRTSTFLMGTSSPTIAAAAAYLNK